MDLATVSTIFGIVGTASGVFFAIMAFRRNNKTDDTAAGKESGVLMTEIGYIKAGVDDIKAKQNEQDKRHIEVIERLSAVEQSAKQAHHRIDSLEGKIG